MRVVVAPEAFSGLLGISEVASALVRGVRQVHPEAAFNVRPVTRGGEGTIDSFLSASGGSVVDVLAGEDTSSSLLSSRPPTSIPVAYLPGRVAAVEAAASRVPGKNPAHASTAAVGEAVVRAAALRPGLRSIIVATGDSGAADGGAGAARAAGYRFLDERGRELASGGIALRRLARIEADRVRVDEMISMVAACDSDHPLLGPFGAARSYGGVESTSEAEIEQLEEGLAVLAERISADLGREVADIPGGASGGGLAAGLAGFFGAETVPGFELLAGRTGMGETIEGADLVLVAARRLDGETVRSGASMAVASIAEEKDVPCFAVAGGVSVDQTTLKSRGLKGVISAFGPFGEPIADRDPVKEITAAAVKLLTRSQEPIHRRLRRLRSSGGLP